MGQIVEFTMEREGLVKEGKADTDKREQAKAKSRKVNKWDRL